MILAGEWPQLPEPAHNGWELSSWVIMGVVAIIGFYIWLKERRKITGMAGDLGAVRDHVVNDHTDPDQNMRTQLDRMEQNQIRMEQQQNRMEQQQTDMGADLRGVKKDVGRLADSAIDDRETHHTDIARVDRELEEIKRRIT